MILRPIWTGVKSTQFQNHNFKISMLIPIFRKTYRYVRSPTAEFTHYVLHKDV